MSVCAVCIDLVSRNPWSNSTLALTALFSPGLPRSQTIYARSEIRNMGRNTARAVQETQSGNRGADFQQSPQHRASS